MNGSLFEVADLEILDALCEVAKDNVHKRMSKIIFRTDYASGTFQVYVE